MLPDDVKAEGSIFEPGKLAYKLVCLRNVVIELA